MKRVRFSLKVLLVLMSLVAVYMAGHRNGFRKGYGKASVELGGQGPGLGAYSVSDLVLPLTEAELKELEISGHRGDD